MGFAPAICHEGLEEVKYCKEDHEVMERLLGALSREDEDAEQVAKQAHRPNGDHEVPGETMGGHRLVTCGWPQVGNFEQMRVHIAPLGWSREIWGCPGRSREV